VAPPKKTHCVHGHLYTEANTGRYWSRQPNGTLALKRNCLACSRARYHRRQAAGLIVRKRSTPT